jgi:putative transcriptional regulator
MQSLQGKLLVSSPSLIDPNFRKTVVLVAHHDDEGAMGLVLSRPSEVVAAVAVPLLGGLPGSDDPVFVGGPVQPEAFMVLAEF